MADKLNDQQIFDELKRFGDTIKLPIDYKKRPILIKKLNHYYAKENPPLKRNKSSGRQPKKSLAPSEFSDDSQDENETDTNLSRTSIRRNNTANNSTYHDSPNRKLRNRTTDNGASTSRSRPNRSITRTSGRNKKIPASEPRMEVYPDEFSDADTADESVYEVEEKSIGINTSLNFDETFDEDELNPSFSSFRSKKRTGATISPLTKTSTKLTNNHSVVTQVKKQQKNKTAEDNEPDQFVSKSILSLVAIFFLILALSYVYIRRDIFFTNEAAVSQSDLKDQFLVGEVTYSKEQQKEGLSILKKLYDELAKRKGRYELGEIGEDEMRMSNDTVAARVSKYSKDKNATLMMLCYELIIRKPEWNMLAYNADGTIADHSEDVFEIESVYGDLPTLTRVKLALYKVLYGLALLVICVCVGVLGIFYMRWQNKKKERQLQKVYDLVEQIIEILKDHSELSESKNDPKLYPAYMAVQHIRDQLIPVAKRRQMQALWDEAVKFIESNESRIRVETQMIQQEEYTVWRWLQAIPNGHKQWQGQAFGETSQGSVNALPYGPTPCLKVRNMFESNSEPSSDDWHLDVEEGILEKCKNNNGLLHIFVDRSSREGCVYIKCNSCEKAYEAYQALHGWWFDGRLITVKYLRLEHYHDRFPDSRNKMYPLLPSNKDMKSVSRPYYRSALEMT